MKKYKIIYDDQDLLVVCKFAGLAVQSARVSTPDLMSLLRNEMLERGEKKPYLGLVNRLDQPVEGIVLIGKNEKAAADLSRQVTDHIHMEKWYQIRVQLSHAGLPICGDAKYGKAGGPLCLCAYKVIFSHPRTGKRMEFEVNPTFPVPSTAL